MAGVLKPGCIEAVEYFVRSDGHLILAAYSGQPVPEGCVREAADTLHAAEVLERRLAEQDARERAAEYDGYEASFAASRQRVRDNLSAIMQSSATSPWEREFIELWFRARDERREKFRQRWLERTTYLHALHFDTPRDRRVDEERVNLDRVNF